jgi:GT2 family glycosyltransferase
VIATKDRPRLVADAIRSVYAGSAVPQEVLVVDQSAVPLRSNVVSRPNGCDLSVLTDVRNGLSAARNRGIAAAAHEVVVLIDDDMIASPDWLEALVNGLAGGGPRVIVTGRVEVGEPEVERGFSPAWALAEVPATYRGRSGIDVLAGGNMAAYTEALVDVGLFDERFGPGSTFPAAEDNDLGHRLLEAGYEIHYLPDATLVHRAWRSDRLYLRYRWRYGLGKGGFYAKHLSLSDRYMLRRVAADVAWRARRLPRSLVSDRRAAVGDAAYVGGIALGLARWARRRRRASGS